MPRARATPERLSAFSDGVFAVLITVLVLELRPPELPTLKALLWLWPTWLSYAVSYLFIAIVWTNHHHLMHYATEATIPGQYQRQIVDHGRKEVPGTIVVDTNSRYLYYVLPQGKAIRYGVTVGEEALAWSGIARIGRKEEWPAWVPTQEIKHRLANIPAYVSPGPHNPMGARALYLYQGDQDTLYRIHGTNQPEYIGRAISSGCIRMTNEDAIDLYNQVKIGAPVVVFPPGQGV